MKHTTANLAVLTLASATLLCGAAFAADTIRVGSKDFTEKILY